MKLAQKAYEAYCLSCGGVANNGDILPEWNKLPCQIKQHWQVAADAVAQSVRRELSQWAQG